MKRTTNLFTPSCFSIEKLTGLPNSRPTQGGDSGPRDYPRAPSARLLPHGRCLQGIGDDGEDLRTAPRDRQHMGILASSGVVMIHLVYLPPV